MPVNKKTDFHEGQNDQTFALFTTFKSNLLTFWAFDGTTEIVGVSL